MSVLTVVYVALVVAAAAGFGWLAALAVLRLYRGRP